MNRYLINFFEGPFAKLYVDFSNVADCNNKGISFILLKFLN